MKLPDWRQVDIGPGILREATVDSSRMVLWLPRGWQESVRLWERIGNLPGAQVTAADGLCATAATAVRASQPVPGFFSRLFPWRREVTEGEAWVLPSGQSAHQQGERETDLLLVWAEDENACLDETRVRSCWPQGRVFERLGRNLFVVSGLAPQQTRDDPLLSQACPRTEAEQRLAAARQEGDRRREASALNDLGILCTNDSEPSRAVTLLEEALTLAGELGDPVLEGDVRGNLGLALLRIQAGRALELLAQALAQARAVGDRYAEKTALDRLATSLSRLREPGRALVLYEQALALTRALGDRRHEAELLWHKAIQHADLGQRDLALDRGQAAVDLLKRLNDPHIAGFAESLRRYQTGEPSAGLATPAVWPPTSAGPAAFVGAGAAQAVPEQLTGPGLLRMAFTAAKAMAQFVGGGLKTVPAETRRQRLQTCAVCVYHTGLRCRVCGCFTSTKTWMVHEQCPLGKWLE